MVLPYTTAFLGRFGNFSTETSNSWQTAWDRSASKQAYDFEGLAGIAHGGIRYPPMSRNQALWLVLLTMNRNIPRRASSWMFHFFLRLQIALPVQLL